MHTFLLFNPIPKQPLPQMVKWLVLSLLLLLAFFLTTPQQQIARSFLLILFILLIAYLTYYTATNFKRFHFIKGTFTGSVKFAPTGIYWQEEFINYQEINKIDFINHDYIGRYHKRSFIQPAVSIGVNNQLTITLKNGATYFSHFQMQHDFELFKVFTILKQQQTPYSWNW